MLAAWLAAAFSASGFNSRIWDSVASPKCWLNALWSPAKRDTATNSGLLAAGFIFNLFVLKKVHRAGHGTNTKEDGLEPRTSLLAGKPFSLETRLKKSTRLTASSIVAIRRLMLFTLYR